MQGGAWVESSGLGDDRAAWLAVWFCVWRRRQKFWDRSTRPCVLYCIVLCGCLLSQDAQGGIPGEFLLFPSLQYTYDGTPDGGGAGHSLVPAVDLFYTVDFGRFRFLGEGFLDTEEQELERLLLGWRFSEASTLWGGRFHNPLGYWNTQFHHGLFLQTSISRPAIAEFEDEGGILPMHVAGLVLRGEFGWQEAALEYDLGLGFGPDLGHESLDPVDFINPGRGSHGLNATSRIVYRPDSLEPTEYGLFAGYTEMPSADLFIDRVEQVQAGLFANWAKAP